MNNVKEKYLTTNAALTRTSLASYLFQRLSNFSDWPPEIAPVPEMISGTAFFPGGTGLWQPEREQNFPDIMVVAQDFSTTSEHEDMLAGRTSDLDSATWRNLLPFAAAAGLDLGRCFFTNAIMGLRKSGFSTGNNPGYAKRNAAFVAATQAFLRTQVEVIRPQLIVILGLPAARVFAAISSDLAEWKGVNFDELDNKELSIRESVRIGDTTTTCVVLLHPSYRHANLRYRRFRNLVGNEAEVSLLKHAIRKAL